MRLLELLAMLGAVQGVLLLFLVVARFRHRRNIPFALLLLIFSIRLGTIPSWHPEALLSGRWLLALVGPLPLLLGPLVWWYVRELSRGVDAMPRFLPLHGTPWLLETVTLSLFLYSLDAGQYLSLVERIFSENPPWWMTARHLGKVVIGGAYAVASARITFGRESRARREAGEQVFWVRVVVVAPLLSMIAFGIAAVLPEASAAAEGAGPTEGSGFSSLLVPGAVMMATIYAFSMLVLVAPGVLEGPCGPDPPVLKGGAGKSGAGKSSAGAGAEDGDPGAGCADDADTGEDADAGDGGSGPGEARLGATQPVSRDDLSGDDLELAEEVRRALEAGAFRESDLTLVELANRLDVHPNYLSAVINRAFGENFCRVLNCYRLEFFLDRAEQDLPPGRTILELAFESGFPSKSTFNRFFKARMGTSPSSYLAERERCSEWERPSR